MEPIYKYSESTVEPLLIEMRSKCVYLRKDVKKVERTDENDQKTTYWTYQEAVMSSGEFNQYANRLASMNAVKGVNDSAHIVQIMTAQADGNNNQFAIMEALADIYMAAAGLE